MPRFRTPRLGASIFLSLNSSDRSTSGTASSGFSIAFFEIGSFGIGYSSEHRNWKIVEDR
jgi:hypothetical protein